MTLRPKTARAIADYPAQPVLYRRPVLRALFAAFWIGATALSTSLVLWPTGRPADDLTGDDWWWQLWPIPLLGGPYLLAASTLAVTATHVIVNNPMRRAVIPLSQITSVQEGMNLRLQTKERAFLSAAVEAANVQAASGNYGTQGELVQLITAAAERARSERDNEGRLRPARYRFKLPDPVFLTLAGANVVVAAVLLLNDGPMKL